LLSSPSPPPPPPPLLLLLLLLLLYDSLKAIAFSTSHRFVAPAGHFSLLRSWCVRTCCSSSSSNGGGRSFSNAHLPLHDRKWWLYCFGFSKSIVHCAVAPFVFPVLPTFLLPAN
jgi:hypothetical protein